MVCSFHFQVARSVALLPGVKNLDKFYQICGGASMPLFRLRFGI